MESTARLISFGLGGHSVAYTYTYNGCEVRKATVSGYDSPESFELRLKRDRERDLVDYPELAGATVLDKRELINADPSLAFRSPLVDPMLSDDVVDKLDKDTAKEMLPRLSGVIAVAVAHAVSDDGDGMSCVSVNRYVDWWRSRGARVGRVSDDGRSIVWKN